MLLIAIGSESICIPWGKKMRKCGKGDKGGAELFAPRSEIPRGFDFSLSAAQSKKEDVEI